MRRIAAQYRAEQFEGVLELCQRAAHRLRSQRGRKPFCLCHRITDDAAERASEGWHALAQGGAVPAVVPLLIDGQQFSGVGINRHRSGRNGP